MKDRTKVLVACYILFAGAFGLSKPVAVAAAETEGEGGCATITWCAPTCPSDVEVSGGGGGCCPTAITCPLTIVCNPFNYKKNSVTGVPGPC